MKHPLPNIKPEILLKRLKERMETVKDINKEDVILKVDGVKQKITKWQFNPFTGGYNCEWKEIN